MNLLLVEYATAQGLDEPHLIMEGRAMLQTLLKDFDSLSPSFLISEKSKPFITRNSIPITINSDIMDWMDYNLQRFDACLVIAPEENSLLYELTLKIEQEGIETLGSTSKAVKICSNKWETYNYLKKKIPVIKTEKVSFNQPPSSFSGLKILKPADGVSCSGVHLVEGQKNLELALSSISNHSTLDYCLMQEFVEGTSVSVSLLCDGKSATPISLNLQEISFENGKVNYNGGITPLEHPLRDEAFKVALEAVQSISGLKGYVGVDLILGDNVQLVEINSRITTPYVALSSLSNINLGEAIIASCKGSLPEIEINGQAIFYKSQDQIKITVN